MAQNITATPGNSSGSQEGILSQRGFELVKLTGTATAVNDTSNQYQCRFLQKPAIVIGGAFTIAVAGNLVTFTSLVPLGNGVVHVWIGETL